MSEITAQAPSSTPPPPPVVETSAATPPREPNLRAKPLSVKTVLKMVLTGLASLRLTVILFVFGILIVFFGTLAQRPGHLSLWASVDVYFRSYGVWIPFQILFPESVKVPGRFPFPGGWLIGFLLLTN